MPERDDIALPSGNWGRIEHVRARQRHVVHVRGDPAPLDPVILRATAYDDGQALKLGPDEWLVLDAPPPVFAAASSCVDITDRQIGLRLSGPGIRAMLAAGCPLDTDAPVFSVGMATRTVFGKAEIVLWRETVDSWRIEVWRSFAPYVLASLRQVAPELDSPDSWQ